MDLYNRRKQLCYKIKRMPEVYDTLGIAYNLTRSADPYLVERFKHFLNLNTNRSYLDIGCGTGNYTVALHDNKYSFIGVEPSELMLDKAKEKCNSIDWKLGRSEAIPLTDASVDATLASLTLHHWTDINKGFSEVDRVLKPQGKFVIFTATPKQMTGYWLNHYFPKMMKDSMTKMPSFSTIESKLKQNGFVISETETYLIKPDLKDLFLYSGKHNPNLYLNNQVRQGISSFSQIANKNEVRQGLKALNTDIANETINTVVANYANDDGDYLFITAEKLER